VNRVACAARLSQFRLGLFDPAAQQPYRSIPASVVNSTQHQQLALDAAHQGMVLLKNNGKLPLVQSAIKQVAVVGPLGT
jgi:beta-glucosidase-like glycosyl hydrolase